MIPYGKQYIDDDDIQSVVKVLKSDFLTQGIQVPKFEENLKNYCRAKFAVAVNSATSALHISCMSLGLKKGDILWTSPISFVASANAALYCGADIDFVDIDYETNNISITALEDKLELAKKNNCLPKIIIPVHMCGLSCDMKSIYKLSKKFNFMIIEDASHAIGGEYNGYKVGSCKYSDITVFSFHPVKIITSGEGGAALTNNKNVSKKLNILRSHGIVKDPKYLKKSKLPSYYEQVDLGYNYRMSDIHAALGNSQLGRLRKFVLERNKIARIYDSKLNNLPILLPKNNTLAYSTFHLYIIKILSNNSLKRDEIFNKLREAKYGVNIHYIPIYEHPYYKKIGFKKNLFPIAEKFYKSAISIPLYPELEIKHINNIVSIIKSVI